MWRWEEFFICPNLLQRLKLSSIECGKFASIIQIRISYMSTSRTQPRQLFSNTYTCFNIQSECTLLPMCTLKPVREVEGLVFFHLPWDLLEQVSLWEHYVTMNWIGLLIQNIVYLLDQETCFYLFILHLAFGVSVGKQTFLCFWQKLEKQNILQQDFCGPEVLLAKDCLELHPS